MNQTIKDLRDQFGCADKECEYYNYSEHDGSNCKKVSRPWQLMDCYQRPNSTNSRPINKLNTKQVTITINITADGEIL